MSVLVCCISLSVSCHWRQPPYGSRNIWYWIFWTAIKCQSISSQSIPYFWHMKLKAVKIVRFEISTSNSEWVILTRGSGDEVMALYRHFQPLDNLPDPSGQVWHIEVSKVRVTRGSQQRAIWQVHTRAAGSDWQVCLTAWQPGGFLSLSDRCPYKCSTPSPFKNIHKKQGGVAFGTSMWCHL